jgi:hypothetical protein
MGSATERSQPGEGAPPGAREVFSSIDVMLAPESLGHLLDRPVATVERTAFEPAGWSSTDAVFEGVHLDGEAEPSLLAKTVERAADWVAVATDDTVDREVRCWELGLLARLPAPATHAVVAAARSGSSYTVLMQDLSRWLLPDEGRIAVPAAKHWLVLDALAAMHVEFWMDEELVDPALGLNRLASFIGHTAPSTLDRIRVKAGGASVISVIEDGWRRLPLVSDPSFAADVQWIADDPAPIVAAGARFPWTLTHGDVRPANLAIDSQDDRVFLLDWSRPTAAPPALDLAYWLFAGNQLRTVPNEDLIDFYVARLRSRLGSRFSYRWWEPQLRYSLLVVFACMAPFMAVSQPEAVAWWMERVRPEIWALG